MIENSTNRRAWAIVGAAVGVLVVANVAKTQNAVIGNVFLQNVTPGTGQIGHANIGGTMKVGNLSATSSTSAIPVFGLNNSTVNGAFGAILQSSAPNGVGVRGTATASTGNTIGVRGTTSSTSGTGVYGLANAAAGTNYGVQGHSLSPNGWAGYFTG